MNGGYHRVFLIGGEKDLNAGQLEWISLTIRALGGGVLMLAWNADAEPYPDRVGVPTFTFDTIDDGFESLLPSTDVVVVSTTESGQNAQAVARSNAQVEPLFSFDHPNDAVYVFTPDGAGGISSVLGHADYLVGVGATGVLVRASAIPIVLWDRNAKRREAQRRQATAEGEDNDGDSE